MKTTSHNPLARVAHSVGRAVGAVEGAVESVEAAGRPVAPVHSDVLFEHSDVRARNVVLAGVLVLVIAHVLAALLYFLLADFARDRATVSVPLPKSAEANALPPEPRLQQAPPQDLKTFRAREDWELNNYHWIDQQHGIAAIPIEDAIKILAATGIPAKSVPPNATLTPPTEGTRLTGFEGKVEPEPR